MDIQNMMEDRYTTVQMHHYFLFEQVRKYLEYTHDYEFLKNQLYDTLKRIIEEYINGIDLDGNNIHLDNEDGLLSSGTPQIQNTWMDAKKLEIS